MEFLNSNIFSAFFGAIVGGAFVLIAQYFAIRHERKKDEEKSKMEEAGLLQALHDEISILWERYNDGMGVQVETIQENEAFLKYFTVTQNYFSIYLNNTDKIGNVSDSELRHLIVFVYTMAMGMVDGFKMNNELVRKYEHYDTIFQITRNESDRQCALGYLKPCQEIAPRLKKGHIEFKDNVAKLIQKLEEYLEN